MLNKINFLFLLLFTYRKKHISIFLISTVLITVLSATLFVSSSIQKDLLNTLQDQADFTVQKYKAGKVLNTPSAWIDEFLEIKGVTNVQGRVYGMHYYDTLETYFMIVGVDMYETQVVKSLENLLGSIDIDKFQSRQNMIIGAGVKEFLDYYQYDGYYIFRPPDRGKEKVYIYDTLSKESGIMSSDMIIMDIDLARRILGVEDGYVTDIILEVKNKDELQLIKEKLIISHFDVRIIQKNDIERYYINLFNYKGGVFLALFLTTLLTFLIILYQRYSMIWHVDSKEIALLRMLGWRIKNIIWLKLAENFIVAFSAYMLGIIFAYIYVFILDAPLLKNIFLGYKNLSNEVTFAFALDVSILGLIFLAFVVPFLLAILIPVYRVAITEPSEVMR